MPPDVNTLIFDARAAVGNGPGLHALIAGVSAYPNLPVGDAAGAPHALGLRQLSSTSFTAYTMCRWLIDNQARLPVPLASIRLLLSPSAGELQREPRLAESPLCTTDNFLRAATDWREDAKTRQDNVTFFYFAGHGLERGKGDSVLVLHDFGDGIGNRLRHAVDMHDIFYGMASAPGRLDMAQTQLYFVDACRDLPRELSKLEAEGTTHVFSVELAGADRRVAPIFFAAAPGTMAEAVPNGRTLFNMALTDCLDNDAGVIGDVNGEDRWHVSVHSLVRALKVKIEDLNAQFAAAGAAQQITPGGQPQDAVICFLDGPPHVEVVFEIDPFNALNSTRIQVFDENDTLVADVPHPLDPHPFKVTWRSGWYKIGATIDPPDGILQDVPRRGGLITPPRARKKVKVSRD